MVAKIIRKVDNLDITYDGDRYTVFRGLEQINDFGDEYSAVSYAIDESKRKPTSP